MMFVFRRTCYDPDTNAIVLIIQTEEKEMAWREAQEWLQAHPKVAFDRGIAPKDLKNLAFIKRHYHMDFVSRNRLLGFDL